MSEEHTWKDDPKPECRTDDEEWAWFHYQIAKNPDRFDAYWECNKSCMKDNYTKEQIRLDYLDGYHVIKQRNDDLEKQHRPNKEECEEMWKFFEDTMTEIEVEVMGENAFDAVMVNSTAVTADAYLWMIYQDKLQEKKQTNSIQK